MDIVSYSVAAKQKQRIEQVIANPDSTSGIVTTPSVIAVGETINIPAGRMAVLPNTTVNGTLVVDGEVFIPSGSSFSKTAEVVKTIADLKTITGTNAEVLGYHTAGDGGGGLFYWDSASTEADNVGTIIQSTGVTTGRWKRVYRGSINVRWFGAKGNGVNDDRQAIQNTIDYLVNTSGGGEIYIPKGSYLIGSIVSPDTIRNGLLIAGTTEYSTNNSIRLIGEGNESVLLAKDNDMCIIRNARIYSNIENIKIDGNGKTNVIGVGILSENIASTTILTSNSYFKMNNAYIENCTTGMRFKVGPTVGGSDSGCFYHSINNVIFNLNTEHLKLEKDTADYNRVTRSVFSNCTFTRGNAGVNILGGTELNFINCNYELINGTAFYYGDTNPANISIFGGYAEGCTKGLSALNTSAPYINVYGYQEAMAHDVSYYFMNRNNDNGINISKLPNSSMDLSFGNSAFASIVADIDRTNSKTLSFTANGTEIFRTSTYNNLLVGTKVDDGLNSKLQVVGTISHKGDQFNLTSNSSIYEFVNRGSVAKEFNWYVGAGGSTPIAKLTTAGTWTNASDIRIKKDIKDIKYGLDTILKLSPKSYKLKQDDSEKIGFIAQEIKDIIPEVVYGKDDDFLTLDYASMVSILVKAVQEQQQQINLLKQKIGE